MKKIIILLILLPMLSCVSTEISIPANIENSKTVILSLIANGTFQKNELMKPAFLHSETGEIYTFVKSPINSVFCYGMDLPTGTYHLVSAKGPRSSITFNSKPLSFELGKEECMFLGSYELQIDGSLVQSAKLIRMDNETESKEMDSLIKTLDCPISLLQRN